MSTFRGRPVTAGMAAAGIIGGVLAIVGVAVDSDWSTPMSYILPLSLPVGVLLAWGHSRAVVTSRGFPLGRVVLMTLQALVLGALMTGVVSVLIGVGDLYPVRSAWQAVGMAASYALVGTIVLGLPMLALIGPVVAIWAVLVRWLGRFQMSDRRARGLRRIGVWAGVVALAVLGSNFAWPLFSILGMPDIGWFVSLVLWFVLVPVAVILCGVSLLRSLQLD